MSKRFVAVLLLTALVAACSGIACFPNFCKVVTCPEVTEEICNRQMAMYVPNGSICGCCAICITYPKVTVKPPGDVPAKICPYPIIGNGEQGYYPC